MSVYSAGPQSASTHEAPLGVTWPSSWSFPGPPWPPGYDATDDSTAIFMRASQYLYRYQWRTDTDSTAATGLNSSHGGFSNSVSLSDPTMNVLGGVAAALQTLHTSVNASTFAETTESPMTVSPGPNANYYYLNIVAISSTMYSSGGSDSLVTDATANYNHQKWNGTSWASLTAPSTLNAGGTSHVMNSDIYIMDGFNHVTGPRNIVQIYDVGGDSWSSGTPGNYSRCLRPSDAISDIVYCLGGSTALPAIMAGYPSDDCESYSRVADSWSILAKAPANLDGQSAVCNISDEILIGGTDYGYDPANQSYRALSNFGYKISGALHLTA